VENQSKANQPAERNSVARHQDIPPPGVR
jgi:hypothetical protein